jgi:hypothetical protein
LQKLSRTLSEIFVQILDEVVLRCGRWGWAFKCEYLSFAVNLVQYRHVILYINGQTLVYINIYLRKFGLLFSH